MNMTNKVYQKLDMLDGLRESLSLLVEELKEAGVTEITKQDDGVIIKLDGSHGLYIVHAVGEMGPDTVVANGEITASLFLHWVTHAGLIDGVSLNFAEKLDPTHAAYLLGGLTARLFTTYPGTKEFPRDLYMVTDYILLRLTQQIVKNPSLTTTTK